MASACLRLLVTFAVAWAPSTRDARSGQAPTQQPPAAIRVGITMVPVDVRVLDAKGNPVTDLKQEEFSLLEDGAPQAIRHFSTRALTAEAAGKTDQPLLRRSFGPEIATENRRVFLVMLGRGRHQAVSNGVDALGQFVRERLLPQDRIALLAWNRATDFTTDHALVERTVKRYGEHAEKIEADLRMWFSGLRAVYGSKEIPPHIQKQIDEVFAEAQALRPREIRPGQIAGAKRMRDDARQTADDLMTRQIESQRPEESALQKDFKAGITEELVGLDFETYVAQVSETTQDLGNLYSGIEYLRHLDGEKHLVLFTEAGLRVPRREDNLGLANVASDARIAVDTIQTGGIAGGPAPRFDSKGNLVMQPLPSAAASFAESFAMQDLRLISETTGGQSSAFRPSAAALDRIDRSTRFQYLLGYYPANATMDRKFRKLNVKVSRPGLTVIYRRGYNATDEIVPLDRRQFVTFNRVYEAGRYERDIQDLKITLKPPAITGVEPARELVVNLSVNISRIAFTHHDGRHTATLNLAVFFGNTKQEVVGETWRAVDLNLSDAVRDRMLREGAPVAITVPLPAGALHMKVVVYDYGSDLLGTAVARIQ